jgi:hypothetical protein
MPDEKLPHGNGCGGLPEFIQDGKGWRAVCLRCKRATHVVSTRLWAILAWRWHLFEPLETAERTDVAPDL